VTQTVERLASILGSAERAELAVEWFKSHLTQVAHLEMTVGNDDGAMTLQRVAYELSDHE
jgi:hypothetical protein